MNVLQQEQKEKPIEYRRTMHPSDYIPKSIKQEAINGMIIFEGIAADLPDGTTHVKAYWAYDTYTLYIWDKTVWRSSTFT